MDGASAARAPPARLPTLRPPPQPPRFLRRSAARYDHRFDIEDQSPQRRPTARAGATLITVIKATILIQPPSEGESRDQRGPRPTA